MGPVTGCGQGVNCCRLDCILKWVQGVIHGEAAGQGGDLLSQNTDLCLFRLTVSVRICGCGRLIGGKKTGV